MVYKAAYKAAYPLPNVKQKWINKKLYHFPGADKICMFQFFLRLTFSEYLISIVYKTALTNILNTYL